MLYICDQILETDHIVMREINRIFHVYAFVILTSSYILLNYFQCLNSNSSYVHVIDLTTY